MSKLALGLVLALAVVAMTANNSFAGDHHWRGHGGGWYSPSRTYCYDYYPYRAVTVYPSYSSVYVHRPAPVVIERPAAVIIARPAPIIIERSAPVVIERLAPVIVTYPRSSFSFGFSW